MLPHRQQQALVEQYSVIPDLHERMTLLLDRARKRLPLVEEEKIDAHRVPGCTSRVWLVGSLVEGRCHYRVDADSALVRGLSALVCEVYDGATPEEVVACETDVLEELKIAAQLSPTRRHGLQQVRRAIQEFAGRQIGVEEVRA